MDIQIVFYWFATIAMAMAIVFFLGMVILLFYIKKKIADLSDYGNSVVHKADHVIEGIRDRVNAFTNLRSLIVGRSK